MQMYCIIVTHVTLLNYLNGAQLILLFCQAVM